MTTATLHLPATPPSMNAIIGRSNRWAYSRAKRRWQSDLATALMVAGVPRRLERVEAAAVLTFTTSRRRDEGNFRLILEKALGDALVEGGWLADDTPDRYRFGAVAFAKADEARTTLTVRFEIAEVRPASTPPAKGPYAHDETEADRG